MKLISTTGVIASKNNCPAAGQFVYGTCATVTATDASGTSWEVGAPAQAFTDGNCGYTISAGSPVEGQCNFPPSGWVTQYSQSQITVDPIYWSHPSNPQCLELAYAGGVFTYQNSFTYYTNYPDTYSGGFQMQDMTVMHEVTGIDGWRLQIVFMSANNWYSAVENDLTP